MAFSKLDYLRDLRGAKISASEFRVLVMVLTYADQHGERAFPGVARLADDCRLSERQVQRCLNRLDTEGYLDEKQRGRRNVGATTYTLTARHPCRAESSSGRHGCPVSTTPVSPQHDMGVVPLGPIDGPGVGGQVYAPRCAKHIHDPHPPKCIPCRDAREAAEAHEQKSAEARAIEAAAIRAAIDDCNDCDEYGRLRNLTDCPKHTNFRKEAKGISA